MGFKFQLMHGKLRERFLLKKTSWKVSRNLPGIFGTFAVTAPAFSILRNSSK